MHLVFLNQYYPPDAAPTGVMLQDLVEELVRAGHAVTVLCASGGYAGREKLTIETLKTERREADRALPAFLQLSTPNSQHLPTIIRLRASRFGRGTFVGKLLDYASYYLGVAWTLMTLHPKPDRIVALTTPPYLSVLARSLSRLRGADHAHWVMDLYPDVMAAHGMLGEKSAIYRILAGLARWGFGGRRRAAVLTLGPDMAERVERLVGTSNIERPTSNIEVKGGDSYVFQTSAIDHQLSTFNSQPSPVEWVPLWGTGEDENLKTEKLKTEIRGGADPALSLVSVSNYQPSTLNSQLASNSQLSTSSLALRHKRGWGNGELIVMYSGNMGLGHRFGEILAAAGRVNIEHRSEELADATLHGMDESLDEFRGPAIPVDSSNHQPSTLDHQLSPTRFVFFGGGRRRVEVETFVRENSGCLVEVHDYAPAAELAEHLQSADVHLASLDDAWTGTMVPSKLQGIFNAGRPVIFIGDAASSIGRWVEESGGGWVVKADDVTGLLTAIAEAGDPEIRLARGRAAKIYADAHFDKRTNVSRVAAILGKPQ